MSQWHFQTSHKATFPNRPQSHFQSQSHIFKPSQWHFQTSHKATFPNRSVSFSVSKPHFQTSHKVTFSNQSNICVRHIRQGSERVFPCMHPPTPTPHSIPSFPYPNITVRVGHKTPSSSYLPSLPPPVPSTHTCIICNHKDTQFLFFYF